MSERNRLFVLGASDPEMVAIENLLRSAGEKVSFACDENHKRVHPGNAYRATGCLDDGDQFFQIREDEVVLVECRFAPAHPLQPGKRPVYTDPQGGGSVYFPSSGTEEFYGYQEVSVIDHHRPGDSGYDQDSAAYWVASSLGQVARNFLDVDICDRSEIGPDGRNIHTGEMEPLLPGPAIWTGPQNLREAAEVAMSAEAALMVAAADHCLEAAYRGRCPGVDPDRLMRWRIETRAAFQNRTVEAVLADVEAARKRLREKVVCEVHPSHIEAWAENGRNLTPEETQAVQTGESVRLRMFEYAAFGDENIPELPEAAAREGIPFTAKIKDRDGREKVVLQSASPDLVKRFMAGEVVPGLTGFYGDPARGFAGGYVAK